MPWPVQTYNNSPINNVIIVDGIAQAKSAVCPVGKTMMMDANEPVFYIKTTDASSVATIEAYRFEKIEDEDMSTVSDSHIKDLIREVLDESDTGSQEEDA